MPDRCPPTHARLHCLVADAEEPLYLRVIDVPMTPPPSLALNPGLEPEQSNAWYCYGDWER